MSWPTRRPKSRATVFLTVASILSVSVLLGGIALPALEPRPVLRWRVGDDDRKVDQFAEVQAGTPLRLELDLPWSAWAYVASWSRIQGTVALFPSERLQTDLANPLPAGTHSLPGRLDDKTITWPSHNVVGPVTYMVVVSQAPLGELETVFTTLRQMGHMARPGGGFEDRNLYMFAPRGGMKVVPSSETVAGAELAAAYGLQLDSLDSDGPLRPWPGHDGIWLRPFTIQGR